MNWLQRSLAKCLDLVLFSVSMHLFFKIVGMSLFTQAMFIPFIPVMFAPIEAVLLKFFHTTLGKSVFGFSYDRPFSLKSAFTLSLSNSVLTLPLFLPVINIFFMFFYIRELSSFSSNRWDELSKEQLGKYSKRKGLRACVITFTILLSTITFAPKFTLTQFSNITGIDYFIDGVNSSYKNADIANWKKIDAKEIGIVAYFPQSPEFSEEKYPIPKKDEKLDLKHFIYTDAAHNYSVTHTVLPRSWTKWGSSLVLGVGINHVVDKKSIVYKKKCKHYDFPALEYKLEKDGKTTTGLLVLVKDSMYKVEFEQKSDIAALESESEHNLLNSFFSSFKPSLV